MLFALLKRAVKVALHEATEEWALEAGLPATLVQEARARRLALAEREAARADARAAASLGVEDDGPPPALPAPAAARLTAAPATGAGGQADGPDDEGLMAWVHQQRQAQVSWPDIARLAAGRGSALSEEALRGRHRRWLQKTGQDGP